MIELTTLFCEIDDFCKIFLIDNKAELKLTNNNGKKTRNRPNKFLT